MFNINRRVVGLTLPAVLVLLALTVTGCVPAAPGAGDPVSQPGAAPAPATESVQRLRVALPPAGIESNRIWAGTWGNFQQFEPMLETLIGNDPFTGEPIPRLAEHWEANDDFTAWTFHLRQGVPFHFDYGEFTARDVVHTWELLKQEDSRVTQVHIWRNDIRDVEIVDDHTVTFHFHAPYIDGERLFSRTGGELYIVSAAQWDATGEDGIEDQLVGTGAYRFKERTLGEGLVMERVDDHWSDSPPFAELEFRWVPDDVTRLAMLLVGEVHMAFVGRDLADDAVAQGMKVLQSQRENMQVAFPMDGLYFATGGRELDPTNPLLDVRVREALNRAVDREEIREIIYSERAEPLYLWGWHPLHEGWDDTWADRFDDLYGYDPDRARELLAEAGYGEGQLEVTIQSFPLTGQPEVPQLVEALHLYFTAVGINASIEELDFAVHLSQKDAEALHGKLYPMRNTPIRTTQEFVSFWHRKDARGLTYLDDYIEEQYNMLRASSDLDERDQLSRDIGEFLFNQYATIPIASTFVEIVVNPDVITDWVWSGESPAVLTHWYLIEPAE